MKFPKTTGFIAFIINNMLLASSVQAELQSNESTSCGTSPRPMRVTARHIDPKGIGYNQGYTTVEGFFPYSGWQNWVPFLDARVHVFNDGHPAANAGLGLRYLTDCRVWGINAYYDYRKTRRQHYNQAAMGLESLGKVWDFRVNGYLPVGHHRSHKYNLDFYKFKGHKAILREKYEYVLAGWNAEAGAHVDTWKNVPLYFAGGPYYLTGKGETTWGGQLRASIKIFEYLELEGNVSYDHLFKWIGQGQIAINVPFGREKQVKKRKNSNASCSDLIALSKRAYQPVDRFEIIPVDKKHTYSAAIDPLTRKPYTFVFVNNTSSSLGTIESPYPTLLAAQTNSSPGDVIYIFPGDGTTTGMNAGIVLSDRQRLWGSTYAQTLPTTLGSITIPAMAGSTVNGLVFSPIITNTGGAVVTLASGNEISGLYLQSQGSNPSILATSVVNANLLNSILAGGNAAGYIGINATDLTGTLSVSGCTFNQSNNGILLQNTGTALTTQIASSTFSNTNDSFPTIEWTLANGAQGNLTLNNSTIASSGHGVQVNVSGTSGINAELSNNQITTAEYGFYVNSTSGLTNIDVALQSNKISTYYQSVYLVQTGSLSATLNQNQFFASSEPVFEVDSNAGSTNATVVVSNNTLYSQDAACVYLNQVDGTVTATINNNTMTGFDYGSGVNSSIATNAISQTLSVQGNTMNVGNNGVYIAQSTGVVSATINNNSILALYDDIPIYLDLTGGTSTQLIANGNTLSGYYGIYANQGGPGNLNVISNNNTAISEYAYYFDIGSGNTNLSMSGNTFIGYSPMYFDQTGGNFNAIINDNTFTAAGYASFYYAASAGSASMNITGNTITSGGFSGADGSALYLSLAGAGTFNTSITDNTLNGVAFAADVAVTAATHNMNLSNNTISSGGGYSLTTGAASATWLVNGNTFSAVNTTPVAATITAGSLCMQLNDNTAYPITGAYLLQNTGGTFTLNLPQGNIGQLTTTGVTIQKCP